MQVYLTMDPFDFRITAQERPFVRDTDMPAGPHGDNWPLRHLTVPDDDWRVLIAGTLRPDQQDRLHIQWWNAARQPGDPLWPDL